MKKCGQPGECCGDHVTSHQRGLAQKKWQVSSLEVFEPYGQWFMDTSFHDQAGGGKSEMGIVTGDKDLGQAPKAQK